jgi:GTP-sensing pleiotropic transcriptional regulator CodY
MQVIIGDMWDEESKADLILVTTNSTVDGWRLVMGRGAALEAASRYPSLPYDLAQRIHNWREIKSLFTYGVVIVPPYANGVRLGAFQVKYDWKSPAEIGLIDFSTSMLVAVARALPDWRIALNYPGIGLGGLPEKVVEPIIARLPANVYIYKK